MALRWLDDEENIRHKARAGGNKSEESAVAGIESDAAMTLIPCSGIARICNNYSTLDGLQWRCCSGRAGRSASASARKAIEETTH